MLPLRGCGWCICVPVNGKFCMGIEELLKGFVGTLYDGAVTRGRKLE